MQWGERAGPLEMQTVLASLLGLPQQAAATLQHQAPASVQKPHQQAGLTKAGSSAGNLSVTVGLGQTIRRWQPLVAKRCLSSRAYAGADSHSQQAAPPGREANCSQTIPACAVLRSCLEWKLSAHWSCCVCSSKSCLTACHLHLSCVAHLVQTGSGLGWSTPSPRPTLQRFASKPTARRRLRHHPSPVSKLRSVLTATP